MKLISALGLPDITQEKITKVSWKHQVKNAGLEKNEKELRVDLEKSKKSKEFRDETFETKSYFKELNLIEARLIFKKRSKMMQYVKMNFANDPVYRKELWKCNECSSIDTQSHIMWCPSFAAIRENLNLNENKHLAKYLQEVLKIRAKSS